MRRSMIRTSALLVFAALLVLLAGGCEERGNTGGDTVGDGTWLLTVDGYGVTEEEFLLFLSGQKAITANYFWTQYQVQPDAAFWTTPVNGEVPLEYAKKRALDALVMSKVTFILAAERDILPYQSYDQMLEEMETENAGRAEMLETGGVFYGLSQFTPFTYYQYLNNNASAELEYSQQGLVDPSREELLQTYEQYRDYFRLGTIYEFEAVYEDGSRETITQSSMEVGKEDYTTELLLEEFSYMQCGQTLQGIDFHGRQADVRLLSVTDLGYAEFESVEESVRGLYARDAISALIQARAEAAQVELDQDRFDAIEMP